MLFIGPLIMMLVVEKVDNWNKYSHSEIYSFFVCLTYLILGIIIFFFFDRSVNQIPKICHPFEKLDKSS